MRWIKRVTGRTASPPAVATTQRQRALDLIAAVDTGGIPLNPARVNEIARHLGLEVSVHDKPEHTIARIRKALNG